MKYKKVSKSNYNIHLINTEERFKTISVYIYFSNQFNEKDIPFLNFLVKSLTSSTLKHKTNKSLAILGENLYGAEVFSSFNTLGNIERYTISLEFLNPKYTETSMIKKSFSFLKECLFEPNILDQILFEINKNSILAHLNATMDNPYYYGLSEFKRQMYKDSPMGYNLLYDQNKISNISIKELYHFYQKMLIEFKVDVLIIGNINEEEKYIEECKKLLNKIPNKKNTNLNYICDNKHFKSKNVEVKKGIKQAQLFIGYYFNKMNDYEKKYVVNVYNSILGGINNSLLFTEIRQKNSLCYSIGSRITREPYSLVIETEISSDSYDKALKLIDGTVEYMSNRKQVSLFINAAKENINIALNDFYDNKEVICDYYYRKEFSEEDDLELKRQEYLKVTVEDIINLNKKIVKNSIYFLKGEDD